ncbi:HD domain-containing protein [Kribbella antiqua]|uniref:HD domain-containing protein n=1 Tax=Kribbella antiqua TaxID=2512217 RepID=A0A4R2IGV5_9ACTN|nr:HD domain-containing protein [Kribbella antiqua]TCO44081.1 HD domain-containing protein [Kribbella antiqua]
MRGELDLAAKLRFARQAVVAQVGGLPSVLRAWLTDGPGRPLFEDREPPDTAVTREVLELARSSYDEPLLGHCLRTWLWAGLFAARDGVKPNEELLYIACLLHDIALTDRFRPVEAGCFAVEGGEIARTTLQSLGAPYADEVASAIAAHMDVRSPRAPVAHLLHAGARLDVAGTRAADLPRQTIREVVAQHPRDGFPHCFATLMRREAAERPNSRAALLWHLGMRLPLNHNPLDRS